MSDTCRPIKLKFSIVDSTNYPSFELRDGTLKLSFADWQEKPVRVLFNEVIAMKWQEADLMPDGDQIEGAYIIDDSAWLSEHVRERRVNSGHEYKHYRFDFNHCGSLEVICISFHQQGT